ncbi:MAG: N-acetylglucosamine-6-phosphate deacetylase [Verrucomicrobiota bacterium]
MMEKTIIRHASVVLAEQVLADHQVRLCDGKIVSVVPDTSVTPINETHVVDAQGSYLVPGFIDLHTHGVHEYLIDNGSEDLARMCEILPQYGVTGFLPTVCPRPKGADSEFLATLSTVESKGATMLGFHLEGPFLTITGALPEEALGANDLERVKALVAAAAPYPAVFSISPDFEGIGDLLPLMTANETPVFITHTKADVKQTQAAIDGGARHATHFYDVFYAPDEMDGGVRPCGAVEAILADGRVSVDFILDGEHVDPVAIEMALQCKGAGGVCLITDSNIGAGLPPARYGFGKDEVEIKYPGGPARMTENSRFPCGLAGSGLTMDRVVRNAVEMLGVDLPQAIRMVSGNPAKVLGLQDQKGKIAEGYDADLVLLNRDLEVEQTWVGGKSVWEGRGSGVEGKKT